MAEAKRPLPDEAYVWHYKPRGMSAEICPICGLAKARGGPHRAVSPNESSKAAWIIRRLQTRGGDLEIMIKGKRFLSPHGIPKPKLWGPTKRVRQLLQRAAVLIASGKTTAEAAAELGQTVEAVNNWVQTHRELWVIAYGRAAEAIVEIVRADAGTDRVFRDPEGHLERARVAIKWAKRNGQPLLKPKADHTLTSFYRDWYVRVRLADSSPLTRVEYLQTMNLWAVVTGDPPLAEITSGTLTAFVEFLKKSRGRRSTSLMNPYTIRKHLRNVQAVLNKAGRPGFRNRDAAGILLGDLPWIRAPKAVAPEPVVVSDRDLDSLYKAASLAERPRMQGVKPAAWWRALIVTALFTGLRRGALLRLRVEDLDWRTGVLNVRGSISKGGKRLTIELPDVVMKHLLTIRADREILLHWPHGDRYFSRCLEKLMIAAGIPRERWFGLHALRRTFGTKMYAISPGAAQLALGHSSLKTTIDHYVRAQGIVKESVDRLQMPDIFRHGRDDGPPAASA